ncbi:hypothetical protein OHV05_35355 (plasmid) [Kitasatospora sp. NBC_00070]|uniref:hypothetical protein n=1 Tax=Kitasatospora sp. NBC_00070 TaxID=2975962 RepID=UPI002F917B94
MLPATVRQVTGWLTRYLDYLGSDEKLQIKHLLARCPELAAGAEQVRDFAETMTTLTSERLPEWIEATEAIDLAPLHGFAHHLRRDLPVVADDTRHDIITAQLRTAYADLITALEETFLRRHTSGADELDPQAAARGRDLGLVVDDRPALLDAAGGRGGAPRRRPSGPARGAPRPGRGPRRRWRLRRRRWPTGVNRRSPRAA